MPLTRILTDSAEILKRSFKWSLVSVRQQVQVTLLTAFLAKETMFKVSNRNTRKRCLLISKITLKTSERSHLTTSYLPEVTGLLSRTMSWTVFPRIYTNLQSKVCFQFCFQVRLPVISSKPIYVILREIITKIFDS